MCQGATKASKKRMPTATCLPQDSFREAAPTVFRSTTSRAGLDGDGNTSASESELCRTDTEQQRRLEIGVLRGSLSLALLVCGASITMPFLQSRRDDLECDAACWGGMTSTRSVLQLVGSAIVGRLSDEPVRFGRKRCLYGGVAASLAGLLISMTWSGSMRGMWLGMMPGALLQQNFNVLKALFSDYHDAATTPDDLNQASSSRASSAGRLGMFLGLAFMIGPLLGGTVARSYNEALVAAMFCTLASGLLVRALPDPMKGGAEKKPPARNSSILQNLTNVFDVPAAKSKACMLMMVLRICMALAFHVFNTIWTVSLKTRFDFGPSDHGRFISFIGLSYALSQGFVARRVLRLVGPPRRALVLMACCLILGMGRWVAFHTSSLPLVYGMFALIVTSLGVMNTVITADTGGLAPSSEIGSVFGVLEAVQSLAGMVGPILGGVLAKLSSGDDAVTAPLLAVVGLYVIAFFLVFFGYERYVVKGDLQKQQQPQQKNGELDIRQRMDYVEEDTKTTKIA